MFAIGGRARRASALALAVVLAGAAFALAACVQTSPPTGGETQSDITPEPEPTPTWSTDGPPDPTQPTQYSGIALGYGGPSNGDLGDFVLEDGRWCQGVTMFWSPPVPEGVTFTVDEIKQDPESFTVEGGNCDEGANSVACLDVVLGANDSLQCGVVLTPLADSPPPTQLRLIGTIDCPDGDTCALMGDYRADQGVTVMVCGSAVEPCESRSIEQDE